MHLNPFDVTAPKVDTDGMSPAELIAFMQREKGWSQAKIAAHIGAGQATIAQVSTGRRSLGDDLESELRWLAYRVCNDVEVPEAVTATWTARQVADFADALLEQPTTAHAHRLVEGYAETLRRAARPWPYVPLRERTPPERLDALLEQVRTALRTAALFRPRQTQATSPWTVPAEGPEDAWRPPTCAQATALLERHGFVRLPERGYVRRVSQGGFEQVWPLGRHAPDEPLPRSGEFYRFAACCGLSHDPGGVYLTIHHELP